MNDLAWSSGSIAAGLVILVAGGELLVRGASRLAAAMSISPLVIGLTVVAFGTSAPELAVSVQASLAGSADLAVGNVVGSNNFNILFILGASALIVPLVVSSRLVRWDVPLMLAASLLVWWFARDGQVSRGEGSLLFAGILAYTGQCVLQSRRESKEIIEEFAQEWPTDGPAAKSWRAIFTQLLLIVAGLALMMIGSRWLISGSVQIAMALGVSELVIGLTIVSVGTSLPEVVTSLVAAVRGERDIAVGNVVGSNLFNLLCVLGLTSIVAPNGVAVSSAALHFDIPVMVAVAVACLPIFFTGHLITRWEGALFFFYYLAYTAYLVLHAIEHQWEPTLEDAMLYFFGPLTLLTIAVSLGRSLGEHWYSQAKQRGEI